jgi:hypothetical protein
MADQPTCGQGLAERSALPAKVGELAASVADNLDAHTRALDPSDRDAENELAAYQNLAEEHRAVAAQLEAIGEEMAGYRDLPMGTHDPEVMTSTDVVAAFERYVKVEQELVTLLQERLEADRAIVAELRRSGEE